ncbi:serine/threonine-protein kinase [Solirubrobacter soli]|uniref:serine/threonine-protein kinase n=1 Tax=Solirubrobacter soli TaxID=363832 RepID=UPI00040A0621|nr:serine/threonine-protein kinase [Solirubrobacter soli]
MASLEPGTIVAGYRIESLVGRGGMGVVYRARQLALERVVALKVIAPELLDDEDVRKRFLAEARAAASVDHPNVIPVHEAGSEDGLAYIAMRFVAGSDLRSLVRAGGALDPVEAADFVAQAGAALDAIHRAGFVHRDVKPANLLVDPGGHVYLTDFGLAKQILTRTSGTKTGAGWVGTLDYVAPEQIRGGRIDARADVYALGGVLHFALTGRVPFVREGDEAKLWAQLSAPPPVPSSVRRGLYAEFDAVVGRAMAKEPDQRYPSAGDLGRAARAAARGTVPTEPERLVARGAAAPGSTPTEEGLAAEASTRTAPAKVARPERRRPGAGVWIGGALVAALVAVLVVLLTRGDAPRGVAATTPTATATATPSPSPTATPSASPVAKHVKRFKDISDRPAGVVRSGSDLFIASTRMPWITRIESATGDERTFHPKVGSGVTAIAEHDGSVWVASGDEREVSRLDGRTGKVRQSWKVPGYPLRLAVDSSGVWVALQLGDGPGRILRYDHDGNLQQTIAVNDGVSGLAAGDGWIWVIKKATRRLARLAPGSSTLQDWTGLGSDTTTMRYADGALWITLAGDDAIARVGTDGRSLRTTAAGRSPAQSVLAGGRLYVASRNDNTVIVYDPDTLEPIGEPIHVGFNPYGLADDGKSVWVTGMGDNSLTRIDYR